ncbi:MAG TPA: hypothetical protein VFL81_00435 [Candidatus Saccharimonadales bacterium]|nr:hypothetical protein [Candidatus Saccharimonadales bacterium]
MSKTWRRTTKHRQASDKELAKIFFLHYELEEIFYPEEIIDLMATARQAVAGEFYFACEQNPRWKPGSNKKRFRGTDNYIIGVGDRPSELARHITKQTHRQLVSTKQLPCGLQELSPKLLERIVARARYDVVLRTVNAMIKAGDIRYDVGTGTWEVNQSNIDDFVADRDYRKEIKRQLKFDDRAWHGRPRRDRGRVSEGVSVSFA